MIDAKQAVVAAKHHAAAMLEQHRSNVEEIERDSYKGHDVWTITLSFPRNLDFISPTLQFAADPLQYKKFLIDFETGELVAIKLRELASQ